MPYNWKPGDRFRFKEDNPNGGTSYGVKGDIGEVIKFKYKQASANPVSREFEEILEVSFFFVELNQSDTRNLAYRKEFLRNVGYNPYVRCSHIEPLFKDYKVDQEPLDDEELL